MRKIPPDLAFNKGVDYFTEIVFFYMFMFSIAYYEMNKSYMAGLKTQERLDTATNCQSQFQNRLDVAKTDLTRIKTLQ